MIINHTILQTERMISTVGFLSDHSELKMFNSRTLSNQILQHVRLRVHVVLKSVWSLCPSKRKISSDQRNSVHVALARKLKETCFSSTPKSLKTDQH